MTRDEKACLAILLLGYREGPILEEKKAWQRLVKRGYVTTSRFEVSGSTPWRSCPKRNNLYTLTEVGRKVATQVVMSFKKPAKPMPMYAPHRNQKKPHSILWRSYDMYGCPK